METLDAALAAQNAGAQRLELCANLPEGGTTPSVELMRKVRARIRLPIFSMIRPRSGNFVYSDSEIATMRREIEVAREHGMNGIVLGVLCPEREIDMERTRQLVEFASPLPVTFHRAFDEVRDQRRSLAQVIEAGAARVLTSGGAATALGDLPRIAELVRAAKQQIIVLPGSGITPSNILELARKTRAHEFHAGLSSVAPLPRRDHSNFEASIRKMAERLASL